MKVLTDAQVADFRRDGFVFPIPMLAEDEIQAEHL